jgi:diguanylate cyclase (GGDEF)-like protein
VEAVSSKQNFLATFPLKKQVRRAANSIALFDEVGEATSLILGVPGWEETLIFNFHTLDDLFQIALRHTIDFVLLCPKQKLPESIEIVRAINNHLSLATIPTVIYHKEPTREEIKLGLQSGADDYLWGEWDGELMQLRIKMISENSRRDIGINPTSELPGPILIEQEIKQRLTNQEEFAVCYLDIDNFKAYNDYRGYFYGDRTIRLVARIIRDIVSDLTPGSFVGHIGGDDFIFLLPTSMVDQVCTGIIKTFDRIIPYRYEEDDRNRGQIITTNRRGETQTYELLTISIAVLIANGSFKHLGEMSHMLADLKSYIKTLSGSNYVVERRKKY